MVAELVLENRLLKKSVTGFDSEAVPDPCVAPWDVAIGTNRGGSGQGTTGWHAVRWNRCTGETFVFSADDERDERVEDSTAWTKHPVQ